MKGIFKFGERKPRTKIGADQKMIRDINGEVQLLIYSGFAEKTSFRYNANSLGMPPKNASSFCVSLQNFDGRLSGKAG